MAKVNVKSSTRTHEGGKAVTLSPEKELLRAVMTCMLFEDNFYEKGSDLAKRITDLCGKVSPEYISELAIKARNDMYLRSVPLFLTRQLARRPAGALIGRTIETVVQRADELAEFMAMYFMDKKQPVSAQVKKGLAKAFTKFNEYQLAKYNGGDKAVKLRDVLFLCHAKPKDVEQEAVWKKLVDNKLEIPDTWETQLSAGKDKKATFERLILEKKLGYMALLRNLRNMEQAKCDSDLISKALTNTEAIEKSKILPFRYMAAHQNVTSAQIRKNIEIAFIQSMKNLPVLPGISIIVVDVSGSMDAQISDKSDMTRLQAASCLAACIRESSNAMIYSFSNELVKVTTKKHGLDMAKEIVDSQDHGGTELGKCLRKLDGDPCDRVIVLTDEQTHDTIIPCWAKKGYIVNLCGYKPSVSYAGNWEMIAGWSDKIVNYISEIEKTNWDK